MVDLHDLLGSLVAGPDPVLAASSDVRARGEQRRRRSHALVAGAAALVVAVGAGTAVALVSGGRPDALVPTAPTPTPATVVAAPGAYLPTPEDANRAAGGEWDPGAPVSDQGLLLHICPLGEGFVAPGVSRFLEQESGGAHTFISVLPAGEPQRWVQTFRQAAVDCPRRAADSEDGKASNSFELVDAGATLDIALIRDTYRECDTCRASATIWVAVASDRVLSVTQLHGAAETQLGGWLAVLRDRLDHPVSNPPSPTPTPSPEEPVKDDSLSSDDLLQVDRVGPVVVGMTLAEAREAAQVELRQDGDVLGNCVYYEPRRLEPDVSLMVIDGVVSRIDVDSGTTTTQEGIGIGASEADVKRTYPDTVVSKHYYTDGHYLRVLSEDGRHAYLFETDGSKVLRFRSGFPRAVDQVEGCA